ncbi:unnamed protein product [Orchesella dallaii]|uniref:RNase III domain-containing protein n=1 Tax=Orchesella dallaii TaxID=48710 RepID=A0ABP1RS45_9HEXA
MRTKLGYVIPDEDFKAIEKNIFYTFNTRNLLEQALTERSSRFYATAKNVGDSDKFQFLGESISFLNVIQVQLLLTTDEEKTLFGFDIGHDCFFGNFCLKYASSIDTKLLKKYYIVPPGDQSPFDDDLIAKYVVGAIFIDAPGDWFEKFEWLYMSYFLNRMELLADRTREMEMEELKKENTIVKPTCAAEQDNTITRNNEDYKNIPWTFESQSLRINAVKSNNASLPPTISSQMKITEAKGNAQHVGIGKERRAETVECKPKSVKEFPESNNYSCYTAPTPRQAGNKAATISKSHDVELERYQGTLACDRKPHPCDYSTGEDYIWAVSMYESKKHTAAQNSKRGNVTELNSDFRNDIFQSSKVQPNIQSSRQPSTSTSYVSSSNVRCHDSVNPYSYSGRPSTTSVGYPYDVPATIKAFTKVPTQCDTQGTPFRPLNTLECKSSSSTKTSSLSSTYQTNAFFVKPKPPGVSVSSISNSYPSSDTTSKAFNCNTSSTSTYRPIPPISPAPIPRRDTFTTSSYQPSPQPKLKNYEGSYSNFYNSSKPPPSPQPLRKHLDQPNPTSSTTMSSSANSSQNCSTSNLFEDIVSCIILCVIGVLIYKWYVGNSS